MSDRLLAEAWRDLAGWRVGMVAADGFIVVDVDGPEVRVYCPRRHLFPKWVPAGTVLPALDSPANWGHWLVWLVHKVDPADVSVFVGGLGWSAYVSPGATCEPERLPDALLRAYMEHCEEQGTDQDLPPSVLAWWKSQQARKDGAS